MRLTEEREPADAPSASRNYGRHLFLKAVAECEPRVLSDLLEGESGQLFKELSPSTAATLTVSSLRGSSRQLAIALTRWAQRWHLHNAWLIDQAIQVLKCCVESSTKDYIIDAWTSLVSTTRVLTDQEMRFTFEHPGGDPAIQTRREIRDAIEGAFEKKLSAYLNRAQRVAKQRSYVPAAIKKSSLWHFQMLAEYQVLGRKQEEIRAQYHYDDTSTIGRILPATARLIGVKLREGRGKRGPDTRPRSRRTKRSA